jgi:tetratricopeptide (TPR) repeat protein
MLETIREFASEQLAASGELETVERAFEEFLTRRAEAAEEGLHGPDHLRWLDRLEAEHNNLRAGMNRALDRGDGPIALKLALWLWEFWETRGFGREGRAWLERSLALAGTVDKRDQAAAESALGGLSFDLGDYDAAETHYRESLEAHRRLGDPLAEVEVLSTLAMIAVNRLAYDEARELGEESLKISRQSGDRRSTAYALRALGMIAREQGQYELALELFNESMAVGRALGDSVWTARITTQIGITHLRAENKDQAQRFFETSRRLHNEIGDRFALGLIACHQGHLVFDAGDIDRAVTLYAEGLLHFEAVGDLEALVEAIEWLAVTAAARGKPVPALRLFGAAAAAREALRLPPRLVGDEKRVASGLDQAMRAAGPDAQAALAAGRTLTLDEGRDEALELAQVGVNPPQAVS